MKLTHGKKRIIKREKKERWGRGGGLRMANGKNIMASFKVGRKMEIFIFKIKISPLPTLTHQYHNNISSKKLQQKEIKSYIS